MNKSNFDSIKNNVEVELKKIENTYNIHESEKKDITDFYEKEL